jgi:L-lactate dehydrogenase complex protein LldG
VKDSREVILGRIREALRVPAKHAPHAPSGISGAPAPSGTGFSKWLPAVGARTEEWLSQFTENLNLLRGEFISCATPADQGIKLQKLADSENWKRVASHAGSLTSPALTRLSLPVLLTDGGYDAREMETCDAGITECDALIAQTGTIVLTAKSGGGRALSVLPPHHVVLATKAHLVPDLPAAFTLLEQRYGDAYPSMMTFITGPSRTGDIERILVLGAHGPKRLTVILG